MLTGLTKSTDHPSRVPIWYILYGMSICKNHGVDYMVYNMWYMLTEP